MVNFFLQSMPIRVCNIPLKKNLKNIHSGIFGEFLYFFFEKTAFSEVPE